MITTDTDDDGRKESTKAGGLQLSFFSSKYTSDASFDVFIQYGAPTSNKFCW